MKNYLRNILWLSSFLFVLSCHPGQYYQLKKSKAESVLPLSPIFEEITKAQVYRASMKFKDFDMGGQLVFRQMEPNVFRIVLMSEIGIKFLDMELRPKERIIHQVNDQLNRPIVLNLFEKDFRLLLMNDLDSYKTSYKKNEEFPIIYKLRKLGKGKRFYFNQIKDSRLSKIEKASKFGNKKVRIQFEDYENDIPRKVTIQHFTIPLQLTLDKVKRKK